MSTDTMTQRLGAERGSVSAFVAVIALSVIIAAGLVLDGGTKIAAVVEATQQAEQAARAGAQAIDLTALRATGEIRLDPDHATTLVATYLTGTGHASEVVVDGPSITVTVTITTHPTILPIGPMTAIGTATATALSEATS